MQAKDRLCFALDVATLSEAVALAHRLRDHVGVFKIGLELFAAEGPEVVGQIKTLGAKVFLDLKLHDIPETVARTMRRISSYGVDYTTVHASGGWDMMGSAKDMAGNTKVIAVTVLTSMGHDRCRHIYHQGPEETALLLGDQAYRALADGLVCSAAEVSTLRREFQRFTLVVPGIRPAGTAQDDQARVATPVGAINAGADIIVVGRPIRDAPDPVAAAMAIVREIEEASRPRNDPT